jgi:hypothetical protein
MEKQADRVSEQARDDRSVDSRASAAECLRLAATTTNPSSRASLLMMAQNWMEKAGRESIAYAQLPRARRAPKS